MFVLASGGFARTHSTIASISSGSIWRILASGAICWERITLTPLNQ